MALINIKLKALSIFTAVFLCSILFSTPVNSADSNQFVTIVNPVRISKYNTNPDKSLQSEYAIIKSLDLSATWLLTYDALNSSKVFSVLKSFNNKQEKGLFLEVTPEFSRDAGVIYHDTGFSHHANSVFLSGYTKEERIKLIDTLFDKYKKVFGEYPSSVGSWWIDSFSLSYMKDKYGIVANLGCSDQFATDGYQIWGQYWSAPYYPSSLHAGTPARSIDNKIDVVTTLWASRDPLNGYYSSLYSTQDYLITKENLDTEYFKKLVMLYASKNNNDFGHITVGLESDLSPDTYNKEFKNQMTVIKNLVNGGDYTNITMKQFSEWYRITYPDLSSNYVIDSKDLLGSEKRAIWYQSSSYRIGINFDPINKFFNIIDLRTYHTNFEEPYNNTPNNEFKLYINIPSLIDQMNNPESIWKLEYNGELVTLKTNGSYYLKSGDKNITLSPDKIALNNNIQIPKAISDNRVLNINKNKSEIEIIPNKEWVVSQDGAVINGLSLEANHILSSKKVKLLQLAFFSITIFIIIFGLLRNKNVLVLLALALLIIGFLAKSRWIANNSINYSISQSEIDSLTKLAFFEKGNVLVADRECLQCSWNTKYRPAVFGNIRNYVSTWSKHPVRKSSKLFTTGSRDEAKQILTKLRIKYIYTVRIGEYKEQVPFSPGDLGIEKIYANANTEIWKVK